MTRALWFALALVLAGAQPILAQQTATLEGTAVCPAVAHWFADGYARTPRKSSPAVQPYLVLFNGTGAEQVATLTLHQETDPPIVLTRTIPARARVVVDLYTAVQGRDSNFSLDVQFDTYGAADLKMWSGSTVVAVAHPLSVCRSGT
jgi:hypothetical protein